MARARNRRLFLLSLLIPVVLLGALGWLTYAAVQRVRLKRPLVEGVKRNDVAAVKALLGRGADPSTRDVPETPFSWQDIWQSLLHRERPDAYATPVLQYAVLQGNGEIVRLLIEHGADVDALSGDWPEALVSSRARTMSPTGGYTALMDAVFMHRADLVRLLLEHGANPNLHPSYERTPLMLALVTIETADNGEAVRMAAVQTQMVDMLLKHGADVRAVTPDGETALRIAVDSDWPAVRQLVERGGDANTRTDDRWSRTLLIEAAVIEDAEMLTFLVAHGADINATDREGRTALMELCRRNGARDFAPNALRLLLEQGANVNAQDKDGFTALMEAAGVGRDREVGGDLEAIKLLLQHGADPNVKDHAGRTTLQKLPPVQPVDEYGLQIVLLLKQSTR